MKTNYTEDAKEILKIVENMAYVNERYADDTGNEVAFDEKLLEEIAKYLESFADNVRSD